MIVTGNRNVIRQLRVTGATDIIGSDNVYRSTSFLGESTRQAHADARAWAAEHAGAERSPIERTIESGGAERSDD